MTHHIFISYSKLDKDFAYQIADDLISERHKIWLDRSLEVGQNWETMIEQRLQEADEVIVILSEHALNSEWVRHEGSMAYALGKPIFPVLIDTYASEHLPIWAKKTQYHSFVDCDYQDAFETLTRVLSPPNPLQDLLDERVTTYTERGILPNGDLYNVFLSNLDELVVSEAAREMILEVGARIKQQKAYMNTIQNDLYEVLNWFHAGVILHLDAVEDLFKEGNYKKAQEVFENIPERAQTTLLSLRALFTALQSNSYEERDLDIALQNLINSWSLFGSDSKKIKLNFPQNISLPMDIQFVLVRIGNEGLANAVMHSGWQTEDDIQIELSLLHQDHKILFSVTDNGKGMKKIKNGFGFTRIENFVKTLETNYSDYHPTLDIDYGIGKGVQICLELDDGVLDLAKNLSLDSLPYICKNKGWLKPELRFKI